MSVPALTSPRFGAQTSKLIVLPGARLDGDTTDVLIGRVQGAAMQSLLGLRPDELAKRPLREKVDLLGLMAEGLTLAQSHQGDVQNLPGLVVNQWFNAFLANVPGLEGDSLENLPRQTKLDLVEGLYYLTVIYQTLGVAMPKDLGAAPEEKYPLLKAFEGGNRSLSNILQALQAKKPPSLLHRLTTSLYEALKPELLNFDTASTPPAEMRRLGQALRQITQTAKRLDIKLEKSLAELAEEAGLPPGLDVQG